MHTNANAPLKCAARSTLASWQILTFSITYGILLALEPLNNKMFDCFNEFISNTGEKHIIQSEWKGDVWDVKWL